jgi:LytS/YehU family sensor histidine kinase
VQHDLAKRASQGDIQINAKLKHDMLHLTVQDNGTGMQESANEGIGLSNTRTRLTLLYGDNHIFELTNVPAGGLLATLVIPFKTMRSS